MTGSIVASIPLLIFFNQDVTIQYIEIMQAPSAPLKIKRAKIRFSDNSEQQVCISFYLFLHRKHMSDIWTKAIKNNELSWEKYWYIDDYYF